MQQNKINAAIQLVPINTKEHPYDWVDKAIAIIEQSGLVYEVGPFSTSIEGTYEEVKLLLDKINRFLQENNCPEWLLNVQYQFRSSGDVTAAEKTDKHRKG